MTLNKQYIRYTEASDLPAIKRVIDAVQLFPSELLDDMFSSGPDDSEQKEFWFTYDDGSLEAVAYCAPEPMTRGAWNLLLIAVHPDRQGEGIGALLMSSVEEKLASAGARVLLVDTSGTEGFVRTRAFYSQLGYDKAAQIRDYYDVGDDKVTFRKNL